MCSEENMVEVQHDVAEISTQTHKNIQHEDFIKDYVECLFDSGKILAYEVRTRFGRLMNHSSARHIFAKHVDAYRSMTKCVDEVTFYKLVHSFALVLFECTEDDEYGPAKTLLNMSFTYYHVPSRTQIDLERKFLGWRPEIEPNKDNMKDKNPKDKKNSPKNDPLKKLRKFTKALRNIDTLLDIQQQKLRTKDRKEPISQVVEKQPTEPKRKYLYEYLDNQPIWKSFRFWEEALLLSVGSELDKHCKNKNWSKLNDTERTDSNTTLANVTFGQLGTFLNNMKCLGLPEESRVNFLDKQCIIGGIKKDSDLYEMLLTQVMN